MTTTHRKNGKELNIWLVAVLVLFATPFVSANEFSLFCLQPGEQINFGELCNPAMPTLTGPTNVCVQLLDNGKVCPALLNTCNSLGLTCGSTTNTTVDSTPPELSVFSPAEGGVYPQRRVLLSFNLDERADVEFRNNNDANPRWKNVCNGCSSYSRERNFDEGLNDLTFRAVDRSGNELFFDVSFRVDSRDPRIRNVEPSDGFAGGEFFVEVDEDNLERVSLSYGVFDDMRERELDVDSECIFDRSWECTTNVDLSDFDGEEITYEFEAEDVAGTIVRSGAEQLSVDDSAPVIIDVDFEKSGKHVTFLLEVDEANFEEITYTDVLASNPREKRLCSRLENGLCEKRISFRDGDHSVELKVKDEAGHETMTSLDFTTDSRVPRIRSIEPSRGFVSGFFEVEFSEMNPETVLFTYGNSFSGFDEYELDVDNDCFLDRNYECFFNVDLSDFDGEMIDVSLVVEDNVGNVGEDGERGLEVDVRAPEILDIDFDLDGDRATVVLEVAEENLEEITYTNLDDSNPREKRFCSRLENGLCDKRLRLNDGENRFEFVVYDEAGNAVAENFLIEV